MIVVLGSDGMLGRAFCRLYGGRVVGLSRVDCDFTDFSQLRKILDSLKCTVLINCAAIIDIAYVEKFEKKSFEVNSILPFNLAEYCQERGCKFVHISTDHFYVDELERHSETAPVTLVNKYAEQKFSAEQLVKNANPESLVIRSSILGYKNLDGKTFIEWILKTIKNENVINGFYDAFTSSLNTDSLCLLVEKALTFDLAGIYNIGTTERYSKFDLIKAIVNELSLLDIQVIKKSVNSLSVRRAHSCGLNCDKFVLATGLELPTMNDTVSELNLEEVYREI